MDKNELLKKLSSEVVTVTFIKKDGTERVMRCTKNLNLIPTEHQPKGESSVEAKEDNVRVFDIEKQGWRSFNYSTLKA